MKTNHTTKQAMNPSGKDARPTSAWPTRDSGPIGTGDGRTWAQIDEWLRAHGSSLEEQVAEVRRTSSKAASSRAGSRR